MTEDDKLFLGKILSDLSVFPHVGIDPADMARAFRIMIIKTLDNIPPNDRYVRPKKGVDNESVSR